MGRRTAILVTFAFLLSMVRIGFDSIEVNASPDLPATMPVVFVDPESTLADAGANLTIAVRIFNLTDAFYGTNVEWVDGDEEFGPPGGVLFNYSLGRLYGFDIQLSWNPNILEYVNHTVKVPRGYTYPDGTLYEPVQEIVDFVDAAAGTYWLARASISPAPVFNVPNANATVFTMTFEVLKKGISPLNLDSVDLSTTKRQGDQHRQAIPRIVRSGEFKTGQLETSLVNLDIKAQVGDAAFGLPIILGEDGAVQVVVRNDNTTFTDSYNLTLHCDDSPLGTWTNRSLGPEESETLNVTLDAASLTVGSHSLNATAEILHAGGTLVDQLSMSFDVIHPPVLRIRGPKAVMPGQSASFDAAESTHPSGIIANYSWAFFAPNEPVAKFYYEGVSIAHTFESYEKNGTWRVVLTVRDSFGVTYTQDRAATTPYRKEAFLVLGDQPPTISITWPENNSYVGATLPLIILIDEPTSWIGYSLNGLQNVTITENTTLSVLPDGSFSLIVYANDSLGLVGRSGVVRFTVDTVPPNVTDVFQHPPEFDVQPDDNVRVFVEAWDASSGLKHVILNYTANNGTWFTINMAHLEERLWYGTIPGFPEGTTITYYVKAVDNTNNRVNTEGSEYECTYLVIPEFPSFVTLPLFITTTLLIAVACKRRRFT